MTSLYSQAADYKDRQIDVGLFGNVPADLSQETELRMELLSEDHPATIVAGKQKLMQRVWLELTTEKGSMKFWPERGCEFFSLIRQRRPKSPAELFGLFALAAEEIQRNLQAEEQETDPPDERLHSLEAVHAVLQGNRLEFVLEIAAEDGGRWQFLVPLPITI